MQHAAPSQTQLSRQQACSCLRTCSVGVRVYSDMLCPYVQVSKAYSSKMLCFFLSKDPLTRVLTQLFLHAVRGLSPTAFITPGPEELQVLHSPQLFHSI